MPGHGTTLAVGELGQEGDEKERNFGVEYVCYHALAKDATQALPRLLCIQPHPFPDGERAYAEIEQISSAPVPDHVIKCRSRYQQCSEAECHRHGMQQRPTAYTQ